MGMTLVLEEAVERNFIEDGSPYRATVREVKLKERTKPNNEVVRRIEFKFVLHSDDEFDGMDIWGSTSTKFVDHPKCKLKAWAEALLGRTLPARYKLETDDLQDRDCVVIIEKRQWEQDGEIRTRNEVQEVQPTKEMALQLAQATQEPF